MCHASRNYKSKASEIESISDVCCCTLMLTWKDLSVSLNFNPLWTTVTTNIVSTFNEFVDLVYYLLVGKEYSIGRRECDIIIQNDMSISRRHALIKVSHSQLCLTSDSADVTADVSKLGTLIRGERIANGAQREVNNGDVVVFGTAGISKYKLCSMSWIVTSSCLSSEMKKRLKTSLRSVGGVVVSDWMNDCSFVVMSQLSVTIKVVCALLCQNLIVTVEYFEDFLKSIENKTSRPDPHNYLPPLSEPTVNPNEVSFREDVRRKSLFNNKTFVFLSNNQYERLHRTIELGGGRAEMISAMSSAHESYLLQSNTCVIACAVSELSQTSTQLDNVIKLLNRNGRRLIEESELGFAVLHCSTTHFCNPLISSGDSRSHSTLNMNSEQSQLSQARAVRTRDVRGITDQTRAEDCEMRDESNSVCITQVKQEPMSQTDVTHNSAAAAAAAASAAVSSADDKRAPVPQPSPTRTSMPPPRPSQGVGGQRAAARELSRDCEPETVTNKKRSLDDSGDWLMGRENKRSRVEQEVIIKQEPLSQEGHRASVTDQVQYSTVSRKEQQSSSVTDREISPVKGREERSPVKGREERSPVKGRSAKRLRTDESPTDERADAVVKLEDSAPSTLDMVVGVQKDERLPVKVVVVECCPLLVKRDNNVNRVNERRYNTSVNFKKFRKSGVTRSVLPRIIGGSSLSVHVRSVAETDDIFKLVQQESQKEEDFEDLLSNVLRGKSKKRL